MLSGADGNGNYLLANDKIGKIALLAHHTKALKLEHLRPTLSNLSILSTFDWRYQKCGKNNNLLGPLTKMLKCNFYARARACEEIA